MGDLNMHRPGAGLRRLKFMVGGIWVVGVSTYPGIQLDASHCTATGPAFCRDTCAFIPSLLQAGFHHDSRFQVGRMGIGRNRCVNRRTRAACRARRRRLCRCCGREERVACLGWSTHAARRWVDFGGRQVLGSLDAGGWFRRRSCGTGRCRLVPAPEVPGRDSRFRRTRATRFRLLGSARLFAGDGESAKYWNRACLGQRACRKRARKYGLDSLGRDSARRFGDSCDPVCWKFLRHPERCGSAAVRQRLDYGCCAEGDQRRRTCSRRGRIACWRPAGSAVA